MKSYVLKKKNNDLKYYDSNGALELDVPSKMSILEVERISKQASNIDSIYNTKYSEYINLEKRDVVLNGVSKNQVYSSLCAQHRKAYKNLFE